jgi:hypothetical protein
MGTVHAPGLPGNWLNGWLAAIGVTVLVPDATLAWTSDPIPVAILSSDSDDIAAAVATTLPDEDDLGHLAIARNHPEASIEFTRKVSQDAFSERAAIARASGDLSLETTVTDLGRETSGDLAHAPLDPPMPQGITLHQRAVTMRAAIGDDVAGRVRRSLAGIGVREQGNGMGFDHRRFPAGVQPDAAVAVDPVIELLAFSGLALLPMRGDGREAHQKGWTGPPSRRNSLTWPVWEPALDRWAIDALLDLAWSDPDPRYLRRWGVTGVFASVAQQRKGASDVGRGYASERAW